MHCQKHDASFITINKEPERHSAEINNRVRLALFWWRWSLYNLNEPLILTDALDVLIVK